MRHVVNFALVFAFFTLAVTGVLAFALPFSLTTTRIHILFGLLTAALVVAHLAHRTVYFKKQLAGAAKPDRPGIRLGTLAAIGLTWAMLGAAAIGNWPPVRQLIEQGHEARHRAAIVRTSPLVGFLDENHRRLIARRAGEGADVHLSLHIGFAADGPPPALAVWAETTTGSMIETLYLDPALAYASKPTWAGRPTPRHHILPIWRNRYTLVSGIDPNGQVDAFTASTPTHSFTLDDYLNLKDKKEFVLCVEVNAPKDSNRHFDDPHLGQPSLWYTAYLKADPARHYHLLELSGHGGVPDQRGEIQYDLENITTARNLIDLLLVRVTPITDPSPEKPDAPNKP